MPTFYGAVDLTKNELRNAVVQNLGSAPASPVKGQLYFDSTGNILYWYNGTVWVAAQGGAGLNPATTVTTEAVGSAPVVGTLASYAREDHIHGMPSTFPPSGAAGGDLAGSTYPNPVIAANAVTSAKIADGTIVVGDTATAFDLGALGTAHPTTTDVGLNGHKLTSVLDPAAAQDAATKNYVDNTTQGLDAKQSVKAATPLGFNITSIAGGAPNTLDGVTLAANDRVLVKDQTAQATNGIYVVTTLGTGSNGSWTRSTDMDAWPEVPSAYVWVEQGTGNADTGWVCTADQGGTLGTTAIVWTQFAGSGAITAGVGLTKTGNTIDLVAGDTSLVTNPDEVHVNTAVIATVAALNAALVGLTKKFAAALTGTASPEVVTHNLNTRDIHLTVLNGASPYTAVEVDWDATTVNTATIRYNPNLGAGYRVVVVG